MGAGRSLPVRECRLSGLAEAGDLPASWEQVPRDWDWIVDNPRRHDPAHVAAWGGLDRFFATTDRVLRARRGHNVIGVEPPCYRPDQHLRLQIPRDECETARATLADARVRIAVMPTGSGSRPHYPSTASWELILRALTQRYPVARLCLVGKLGADDQTRARSPPASSPTCSRQFRPQSIASTVQSWTSSHSSRPVICSSHRTRASAWPRSPSRRRG